MAQLQKEFLALIPNLKNTNLNTFKSIHFIDAENMIGRVTFKSNYVKRYVALLNEFFEQYLKVYDDKESLFIFSAHREYVASSGFLFKGLEKNQIYSIPSFGKEGSDLVLIDALVTYLFDKKQSKYNGRIYIASSDKRFAHYIQLIQNFSNNFFLIISSKGNIGGKMLDTANFIKVFGLGFPDDLLFFVDNFATITGANDNKNFFSVSLIKINEEFNQIVLSIKCSDPDDNYFRKFIGDQLKNYEKLRGYVYKFFGMSISVIFNSHNLENEAIGLENQQL
jgi:hypothetical protein